MHVIKARKWTWAGHIAHLQDNRFTSQVTDWRPMHGNQSRNRPLNKSRNEIDPSGNLLHVSWMPKTDCHGKQC